MKFHYRSECVYVCAGDRWDLVETVTVTALDDLNIDQLEQTVLVSAMIHSLDTEYAALGEVATINVIVVDNTKCRHCGMGNIQPFDHVPYPPMLDITQIILIVLVVLILLFITNKVTKRCRKRYSVEYQYGTLNKDGLSKESDFEKTLVSSENNGEKAPDTVLSN